MRTTITDIRQWKSLTIVTSEFHMPRTRAIFDVVFALDCASAPYCLRYVAASDDGLAPDMLALRREREGKSLASWQQHRFASLAELHAWLYGGHACYAVHLLGQAAQPTVARHMYTTS